MNFNLKDVSVAVKTSVPVIGLIAISLAVNFLSDRAISASNEASGWVTHTYQVMGTADAALAAMVNQETGMRGFLVSGEDKFLEPQIAGAKDFVVQMDKLAALTSDNPAQQTRISDIRKLAEEWHEKIVVAEKDLVHNKNDLEGARKIEASGAGKASMDGMRKIFADLREAESSLLAVRDKANAENTASAKMTIYIGAATIFVIGLLTLLLVQTGIVAPLRRLFATMTAMTNGEIDKAVEGTEGKDEIGMMSVATEKFRIALVNNRQLEKDAETNRLAAEESRIQTQKKAEEDAAQKLRDATSGLGAGLRRLANGELNFQLDEPFSSEFEALRQDFNASVQQLGTTLSSIMSGVGVLRNNSQEIANGANELSKRTEQQAASLEETAAALDQITANVSSSAKRADDARVVSLDANKSAVSSGAVVSEAVNAMSRIEQSSKQISNIIGVIDEIAFQTNLLALNAGVEAARAGDAGKGFAVVAQEVRELAQRSASAAKEIKGLIQTSEAEVTNGVKLVSSTGVALKSIGELIATVNDHMEAIATSSKEQSVGLAQVNTAVNQMDQTTQQNAAMVEESNAAADTLASEVHALHGLVSQFQLAGGGSTARPAAARPNDKPVDSPARQNMGRVAKAFGGQRGSAAVATETWEDF
jgi:methyl-accepting chemotaxis protein